MVACVLAHVPVVLAPAAAAWLTLADTAAHPVAADVAALGRTAAFEVGAEQIAGSASGAAAASVVAAAAAVAAEAFVLAADAVARKTAAAATVAEAVACTMSYCHHAVSAVVAYVMSCFPLATVKTLVYADRAPAVDGWVAAAAVADAVLAETPATVARVAVGREVEVAMVAAAAVALARVNRASRRDNVVRNLGVQKRLSCPEKIAAAGAVAG